jgi:hypothetical protein
MRCIQKECYQNMSANNTTHAIAMKGALEYLILFSNKMLHFIGKASRKTRCQFCASGHKTRLMQSPTRLRRYKTLL